MRTFYLGERGFTLMEILVAVGIAVLLITIVAVNVSDARQRGRDIERESELAQLQIALRLYNDSYGTYLVEGLPAGDFLGYISNQQPAGADGRDDGSRGYETVALAQILHETGFLPTASFDDPNPSEEGQGYMFAVCNSGTRYALYATKESASQEEQSHAQGLCGGTSAVGTHGKNYGVGN